MDFLQKAQIIIQFTEKYFNDEDYNDFFIYNDLGVPIALALTNDMVSLKAEGEKLINETWIELCNLFNANPDYEYEDLEGLFE